MLSLPPSSYGNSRRCAHGALSESAVIGLVTLLFDLSTFKEVHGLPYDGLPSCHFGLPKTFRSRVRLRHATDRQTDRQTDTGRHFICPFYGGGGITT